MAPPPPATPRFLTSKRPSTQQQPQSQTPIQAPFVAPRQTPNQPQPSTAPRRFHATPRFAAVSTPRPPGTQSKGGAFTTPVLAIKTRPVKITSTQDIIDDTSPVSANASPLEFPGPEDSLPEPIDFDSSLAPPSSLQDDHHSYPRGHPPKRRRISIASSDVDMDLDPNPTDEPDINPSVSQIDYRSDPETELESELDPFPDSIEDEVREAFEADVAEGHEHIPDIFDQEVAADSQDNLQLSPPGPHYPAIPDIRSSSPLSALTNTPPISPAPPSEDGVNDGEYYNSDDEVNPDAEGQSHPSSPSPPGTPLIQRPPTTHQPPFRFSFRPPPAGAVPSKPPPRLHPAINNPFSAPDAAVDPNALPLPEIFSPHRRGGSRYLTGGLASELRDWLVSVKGHVDATATSIPQPSSSVLVEQVSRAEGMVLVSGRMIGTSPMDGDGDEGDEGDAVRVILAGEGTEASGLGGQRTRVVPGAVVAVSAPAWDVQLEGTWSVVSRWEVSTRSHGG